MKKLIINITEGQVNMLNGLKDKFEVPTVSEVIRRIIPEAFDSYLNNYKEVAKSKIAATKSPEEKIKGQIDKENFKIQAREQAKTDKQIFFCHSLGGKSTDDGYCEFSQFVEEAGEAIAIIPQREPLESMNERSGDYQYLSVWADSKTPKDQKDRILSIAKNAKNKHIKLPINK